jgi:hypothetical protein
MPLVGVKDKFWIIGTTNTSIPQAGQAIPERMDGLDGMAVSPTQKAIFVARIFTVARRSRNHLQKGT